MAPFDGAKVTVPALYIAGDRDPALAFPGVDRVVASLATTVPQLRGKLVLPAAGIGHSKSAPLLARTSVGLPAN